MSSEPALAFDLYVAGADPARPRLELALQLEHGITTLTGHSGAGKSTCLLALAGLLRPARGRIVLAGHALFDREQKLDVPPRRRKVALLFQSLALFPHLSAEENIAFALPRQLSRAERGLRARQWLARMRIAQLGQRMPGTLSGGEAQRVALARALASAPRLLLLDEPFSALDPALRRELACEVDALVSELAIPALLVTHAHDEDAHGSHRVVTLREGRLFSDTGAGRPAE
jgi:molybdate transport system ATP-binding protein